jgi:ribosomal protein S17
MSETTERSRRKERQGVVVSDVQDKTIVVRVERRTTHPLYGKTMTGVKKYHVHDEANDAVSATPCASWRPGRCRSSSAGAWPRSSSAPARRPTRRPCRTGPSET